MGADRGILRLTFVTLSHPKLLRSAAAAAATAASSSSRRSCRGMGAGVLRFPHARDDPRLGACAHERAFTYPQMPRLQWLFASFTQPSCTPPCEDP